MFLRVLFFTSFNGGVVNSYVGGFVHILGNIITLTITIVFNFITCTSTICPSRVCVGGSSINIVSGVFCLASSRSMDMNDRDTRSIKDTRGRLSILNIVPIGARAIGATTRSAILISNSSFNVGLCTGNIVIINAGSVRTSNGSIGPTGDTKVRVKSVVISVGNRGIFSSRGIRSVLGSGGNRPCGVGLGHTNDVMGTILAPIFIRDRKGCGTKV